MSPVAYIVTPLAILTMLFGAMALAVSTGERSTLASPLTLLIVAALLYATTIFLMSRNGLVDVKQLEKLSKRDVLTQLPNRRALHADLEDATRNGAPEVALALLDLDRFKQVNDHYGHNVEQFKKVLADLRRFLRRFSQNIQKNPPLCTLLKSL